MPEDPSRPQYVTTPYRFVEIVLFMLVGMMTQINWVTFAPIMKESAQYYSVNEAMILFLAASFMVIYIPVSFPANYALDKLGLKNGVGVGVILTCFFGFLRAVAGTNFQFMLFCQIMCAIGQPFVLNSFTKMATMWFAQKEKATASGLCTIATLVGAIIGMMAPEMSPNFDISTMLYTYGIIELVVMVLFFMFAREKPVQLPNAYADKSKAFVITGTRDLFKNKDFNVLLVILFVGLGIFNAISSEIDLIFPHWDAGIVGGVLIIGGVFGAVILSSISDQKRKRKIFLLIAMIAGCPLSILLAVISNFTLICIIAFLFGFLLVSAMPVGLTYAAEITFPIPEESSNGLLMVLGQIGGLLFLLIPSEYFLFCGSGLFLLAFLLTLRIHDVDYYEAQRK